jgi:hypothetical protein
MPPAPKHVRRRFRFSLRTLIVTIAFVAVATWLWSHYLDEKRWRTIPWQPFSRAAMRQYHAEGHDVLASFTADWDVIQKMLEHYVDTPKVRRALRKTKAVPLQMDCTPFGLDVEAELSALGRKYPPLIVIYPATGEEPIVLDLYGETAGIPEKVVESLVSRTAASASATVDIEDARSACLRSPRYNSIMSQTAKHTRRWYQFGLGTMFSMVTLLALWLGWNAHQVRQRNELIDHLRSLRGQPNPSHSWIILCDQVKTPVTWRLMGAKNDWATWLISNDSLKDIDVGSAEALLPDCTIKVYDAP